MGGILGAPPGRGLPAMLESMAPAHASMLSIARAVLTTAAFLIALGGLYDLFTPELPANLIEICAGNERARNLVRELLRALGAALVAIGITVAILVISPVFWPRPATLMLVLVLVVPAEGINAFC